MLVKAESRVISHAGRGAGKRRSDLAGGSAGGEDGGAAGRPETNNEEQDEDRSRSERDRLQKAEKELREGHCSIMGVGAGGGEITSRVDLRCAGDGRARRVGQPLWRHKDGSDAQVPLWKSTAKILCPPASKAVFERVSFRENLGLRGNTPLPLPSESLDWRGFCKKSTQNLEPQGF